MAIQDVTANVSIRKMTFDTEDDLWDLYKELKGLGWFGGVFNSQNTTGGVTACALQMTSPDETQLVVMLNATVVAVVNGVYSAMTEEEYQSRYPATQQMTAKRKATTKR